MVYCNLTAARTIGARDVAELLGKAIIDFVHPDSRSAVNQRLNEMGQGQDVPLLQEKFVCLDERVIDVEVIAYPFVYQHKDAIQVVFQDITERKRAEARILRQAAEMTALYETTHNLVNERSLSKLLLTIVERATGLLEASSGGLYLCEPEQRQVRCVVSYKTPRDFTGIVLKYGEGAAGIVAETGESLIIADYRSWEGHASVYEEVQPFVSLLSVPICWQDHVIGILHVIENTRPGAFTQEDLQLLTLFANQAAIAVENTHLLEFDQRRLQEAAALAEVGRDISASLQLNIVLERITSHAKNLLLAETSAVYLSEPATPGLRAICAIGPDAEEIKQDPLIIGEGILGNIAAHKTGEIVNHTTSNSRAITIKGTIDIPNEHIMGAPVMSGDKFSGLIAVWRSGAANEFIAADLNFLTSLAQQAAIAIENARLFEETQKRLREIEGIANASAALSQILELEPLLETILQSAIHAIPVAERGSVLLANDEGKLQIRATWGYTDPRTRTFAFSPDAGYSTISFRERRAIVVPDVLAEPRIRYAGDIPEMLTGGSAIAAPLVVKGRAIGVIALDTSARRDAFDEDDARFLEALAAPAALAIENARMFEYTRRRLNELEILQTIASAMRIAQSEAEVFPIILDQLINLLNLESALVDLIDPTSGEIVTTMAKGVWEPMTGKRTPVHAGGSGQVIATGKPYVSTDVIADGVVAFPELVGGLNAAVCVPVMAHHQPIGTLWVGRGSQKGIANEEVDLLIALGEMIGNTFQRMKLHKQTVQQAEEILSAYDLTLAGWAKALELRDKETEGHSRRITNLTLQLARLCGITSDQMHHVYRGVLLHDIGKMGVSDQVLKKAGPLNVEEWAEMRKHPQYAYDLLYPIAYLRPALDIPYSHHEKWDGSGYPLGLKGEQIPLPARIFAVVDVYDALSTDRPYRAAWPNQKVLDYLRDQAGKSLDPQIVELFLKLLLSTDANQQIK